MVKQRQKVAQGAGSAKGRKTRASAKDEVEVLVPLHETDALIALSAGAIGAVLLKSASHAMSPLRHRAECFSGVVPGYVTSELVRAAGFGQVIVFQVVVRRSELQEERPKSYLILPVSVSRIRAALVASDVVREMLVSRVRLFPDVVLDAVPLSVSESVFASDSPSPSLLLDELRRVDLPSGAEDHEASRSDEPFDKIAGAIAVMLYVAGRVGPWHSHELDELLAAFSPSEGAEGIEALVMRLCSTSLHSGEERLGIDLVRSLAGRIATLSMRDGFEPEALLREIADAVQPGWEGGSGTLARFVSTAVAVINKSSSSPRDIYSDGGSALLRGSLAFLSLGSLDDFDALLERDGSLGRRVAILSACLFGAYSGLAAMPTKFKAVPLPKLFALGDITEAHYGTRTHQFRSSLVADSGGRTTWVAHVDSHELARVPLAFPPELRVLAKIVEDRGYDAVAAPEGMHFVVRADAVDVNIRASLGPFGQFEPPCNAICLSAYTEQLPTRASQRGRYNEGLLSVAAQNALSVVRVKDGDVDVYRLCLYLQLEGLTGEHVAVGIRRLVASSAEFFNLQVLPSLDRTVNTKGKSTATKRA